MIAWGHFCALKSFPFGFERWHLSQLHSLKTVNVHVRFHQLAWILARKHLAMRFLACVQKVCHIVWTMNLVLHPCKQPLRFISWALLDKSSEAFCSVSCTELWNCLGTLWNAKCATKWQSSMGVSGIHGDISSFFLLGTSSCMQSMNVLTMFTFHFATWWQHFRTYPTKLSAAWEWGNFPLGSVVVDNCLIQDCMIQGWCCSLTVRWELDPTGTLLGFNLNRKVLCYCNPI